MFKQNTQSIPTDRVFIPKLSKTDKLILATTARKMISIQPFFHPNPNESIMGTTFYRRLLIILVIGIFRFPFSFWFDHFVCVTVFLLLVVLEGFQSKCIFPLPKKKPSVSIYLLYFILFVKWKITQRKMLFTRKRRALTDCLSRFIWKNIGHKFIVVVRPTHDTTMKTIYTFLLLVLWMFIEYFLFLGFIRCALEF